VPGIGDRALIALTRADDGTYTGKVKRLLDREQERLVGVYRKTPAGDRIEPTDRRVGRNFTPDIPPDITLESGDLVLAEALPQRRYGLGHATVVKRLGALTDPEAVSLIAIASHAIPTRFPEESLQEAADARAVTSLGKREDLRDVALVTIDDVDARDHDDAVWAEPDTSGKAAWHAIVAIADVGHYVTPGCALDRAAYRRGNSVYLPDLVVPMLPERLSNDLCSLRPKEDRPCLAVHLWIGSDGALHRWRFVRGLMRSAARLTYDQVQGHRDGRPDATTGALPGDLIEHLYGVYDALRTAREARGALDIDRPERKVVIGDDGKVADIRTRVRHDSHRLIEEMMITANVAAARALEERRLAAMYRIHDQPSPEKADALREYLESQGLSLRKSAQLRPRDFNHILQRVHGTDQQDAINEAVLRSQAQAEYAPENIGHFGLALAAYCHFTSPIRRYADLLVHRALIGAFGLGTGALPDDAGGAFDKVGVHLSAMERRATRAERDAVDRFVVSYMADRVGATMTGRITGVGRFGVFVRLDDTGADGLLPASRLPGGPFRFMESRRQLVGHGVRYDLGEPVTVKVAEVDPVAAGLSFELVEGGTEQAGRPAKARPGAPGKRAGRTKGRRKARERRR
jgi:ribonuclease R